MTILSDIITFIYRYTPWVRISFWSSGVISVVSWDYIFWDSIVGDPFPVVSFVLATIFGILMWGGTILFLLSLVPHVMRIAENLQNNWSKHIKEREAERKLERVNSEVREEVGGSLSIPIADKGGLSLAGDMETIRKKVAQNDKRASEVHEKWKAKVREGML